MKVAGGWIDHPGTQTLCKALEAAGHRALFVGGCVRNALLGATVADVDLTTDALPQTVTDLAEAAGFRVVPTGIAHGTVTVIADGLPHEVTTFRRDLQTDGRHAVVAFATEVAVDAARRDFTMNALYADRTGAVIDPLGGLPDLLARQVRFVGEAQQRIREDYLRILRFFRFHAWYGDPAGGIDADGLAACASLISGLGILSRERIGAEMVKLLSAPDPAPSIASMSQAGVLQAILPGSDPRGLAPLVHLEGDLPPRWQRRLAVLGGAADWRLARAQTVCVQRIRDAIGTPLTPAALGWTLGQDLATDTVLARAAMLENPLPQGWQAAIARGAAAVCPMTAADLMPALHGAALGQHLQQMQDRWLASDLTLNRDDLLG